MYSTAYQNKVQLFMDAANFKNTRLPNLSNDYTWKIYDEGVPYKEAYHKSKSMGKLVCANHERYQFDSYLDLGTRNHFPQMEALGGGAYVLNEETGGINVTDAPCITAEDLKDFAANPMGYLNIMFQRKFPDLTTDQFVKATTAFLQSSGYAKDIQETFATKYDTPLFMSTSASVQPAFESFHSSFMGIKDVSMAMRRNKEELKEACDAYYQAMVHPSLERALKGEKTTVVDVYTGLIGHCVLNQKQFELFYYPELKQIVDETAAAGKTVYLYVEGSIARFAEYFQDFPKGTCIMHLEQDDPIEMRKLLPNMCIAGGMTTDILGTRTPAECVDYAKRLVDEMGQGFIMSQNKMLSFKNDCRRENLLAVNEYVRSVRY